MSEQTLHLVASIRQRLQATTRRITLAELTFGLVLTTGVLAAVWLLSVAVEAGFWLDVTPRAVLFWTLALLAAGLFTYFLLLPALRLAGLLHGPSEEAVAARIGDRYPEVSDRLINLLHLSEGRRSDAPAEMIDGAVRMLGEQVHPVAFEQVEDFSRARRAGRYATLPVLGLLVFLLAAPGTFLGASQRLLSPGVYFQRPAPFQLAVTPGSVEMAKGGTLEITVHAEGQHLPRTLVLALNNLDEEHVEEVTLSPDSTGVFRHTVVNVRKSMRYQVAAAPVRTPWYTAEVTERPLVRGLQVTLHFPAYTGIPPQRLDPNVGDVTALPGTRVSVEAGIGGPNVQAAYLHFDDGRRDTLTLDGVKAAGTFTLSREGSYQIRLRNDQGLENDAPITYNLQLLSDAYPSVVLLAPGADAALNEELQAGLHLRMNDDFGFSQMRLFYRLAEARYGAPMETFASIALPLEDPRRLDQELWYDWLVTRNTELDPVPGDVIEYYVQVWDNDSVSGYKSARTATQRLRLPSLAEKYEALDEQQDAAESQMEDLMQQTERIEDQFETLRDELRRKQDADWEDKRQLEQLQQRQQQLEEQVESLSSQMEEITRSMQENDLVSDETMQMYQEMQKVVEEINSPELQEALKQLQQSIENLNLQQMQESLQNFEFNEQQYQERLERTLDLFKRLRTQQELDRASRLAEELARQEERLREATRALQQKQQEDPGARNEQTPNDRQQTGERQQQDDEQKQAGEPQQTDEQKQQAGDQQTGEPQQTDQQKQQTGEQQQAGEQKQQGEQTAPENEELAREQDRAREQLKALEEQLRKLQEQMKASEQTPSQQMQQLNQQMQQQQMQQQMQQNSQQLRQNQLDEAQQGQQQMQQQFEQLSQQLQQMQQQMQGQQMQVNLAGLRRALSDVLTLSQQQEDLRARTRNNTSEQPLLREDAQQQVELSEALSTVSDSLQQLARQIPQMSRQVQVQTGNALQAMGAAVQSMTDRSVAEASGHQKTSMMHMNELALLLSDLMNQLMNQQSGGQGNMSMQQMLQQMQQMGQQQQQLNQQIQQMLNDIQGNRLSQDMQQRLQQMARQQEAIRRQLKELSRNPEARGKMLGDLNKIAEQMEETIEELRRQQVEPRMIERQRQILSRLLDAQRSLRERGQDNKRESREGRDRNRQSPAELTPAEAAEQLRRDLIRALESGYAPDYEELIKRYFELLQEQQ